MYKSIWNVYIPPFKSLKYGIELKNSALNSTDMYNMEICIHKYDKRNKNSKKKI